MTLTTAQLRKEYDPPGKDKGSLYLAAYGALDNVLRRWKFDGGLGDTGAYNFRKITGGTGYSLHAYGPGDRFTFWWGSTVTTSLAVDIDWEHNPYGPKLVTNMPRAMVDEILAIRTVSGVQAWRWGGDYGGNKDAMHFEIVCSKKDLQSGIRGAVPTPTTSTSTNAVQPKEPEMLGKIIANRAGGKHNGDTLLVLPSGVSKKVDQAHVEHLKAFLADPTTSSWVDNDPAWDAITTYFPIGA